VKLTLPAVLAVLFMAVSVRAQTPVFTYHGQLQANGSPANGDFDLRFSLHDASSSGSQVGSAITNAPVGVTNGLFVTTLNFGSGPFNGNDRWLEIGVRTNGDTNAYTVLSPRQQITSVPYAIRAANFSGTLPAANLTGTLPDARLSPNVALLNSNVTFLGGVTATQFNGSGAGLFNVPAAGLTGTLPDARLSTNVALLNGTANFSGNVSAPFFSGNGTGLTNVPGRIFDTIPTASAIQSFPNTGYLATNDVAPVVVTLPPTLRVGETVRVSGSGAGGWIVAQNAGQSVLVGNLLDTVGLSWTPRDLNRSWKAAASSVDGQKLVAAHNGGQIYTSANFGETWTPRAANFGNQNWSSVASSGDGSKLVATANTGVYTSPDSGVNWFLRIGAANWSGVASSLDGTKIVAVVNNGSIYASPDSGASWGSLTLAGVRFWNSVVSSANGQYLAATVSGGQIYTSSDAGGHWAARESNRTWAAVASSADGSRLVAAVNNGQLYVSSDAGTNWVATGPSSAMLWTAVAASADGSRMAAVINGGGIYISMDSGVTWNLRAGLPNLAWLGVASSADASTLVAVPGPGQIYVSSQATTTTTTGAAGYLSGTRQSSVELQYIGGGVFMPIGFVGAVRPH
jgi:hypothetical protein